MTANSGGQPALASRGPHVCTLGWDGTLMRADSISDDESFGSSETTMVDSTGSALADSSSEDGESLRDAFTKSHFNRYQTEPHKVQVVLKNTFVHVSDGIDAERQKAMRRVQSCPPCLDCKITSLNRCDARWHLSKSQRLCDREAHYALSVKGRVCHVAAKVTHPRHVSSPSCKGYMCSRRKIGGQKKRVDEQNDGVQNGTVQSPEVPPSSVRFKNDDRFKCVQITRKSSHPKVQHKQLVNCAHAPSKRKGLSGWRLRHAVSPCTLSWFIMLLIILWGKIGEDNSIATSPSRTHVCFSGPSPSAVNVTSDPRLPDSTDFLPTITLYAPCLLESFAATAATYQETATAWNYVESNVASKVELRNYRETPIVHWKDLNDAEQLQEFLIYNMMPQVGKLNAFTSQFYGSIQQEDGGIPGLIIGFFEPDIDDEQVNDMYRPMFAELAEAVEKQFRVAYMNTRVDKLWIESEFGVTSFPTIAVVPSYPGKPFLYKGDLSAKSILLHLQDIGAGCLSHGFRAQAQDQVCDAMPVLRD